VPTLSISNYGINEVILAGKYISQFLEHLGFTILDEWYILSEYHCWKEGNTEGRMGDIRGKPNKEDLIKIRNNAEQIGKRVK